MHQLISNKSDLFLEVLFFKGLLYDTVFVLFYSRIGLFL